MKKNIVISNEIWLEESKRFIKEMESAATECANGKFLMESEKQMLDRIARAFKDFITRCENR